jgi:hypothetical protein
MITRWDLKRLKSGWLGGCGQTAPLGFFVSVTGQVLFTRTASAPGGLAWGFCPGGGTGLSNFVKTY